MTSDIVLKEMYEVKGIGENKENLVLRPEGTAGVLNNIANQMDLKSLSKDPA